MRNEDTKRFRNTGYLVTKDGNILNKKGTEYLKGQITNTGYYQVILYIDGKPRVFYKHRVVAEVFLEKKDETNVVNHKDGDKLNNNVGNLEWTTRSENTKHAVETGLFKAANGVNAHCSKLTEDQVIEIRKLYKETKITQNELGRIYNLNPSSISDIVNRVSWKHI